MTIEPQAMHLTQLRCTTLGLSLPGFSTLHAWQIVFVATTP